MVLPEWVPKHLGLVAIIQVLQFFVGSFVNQEMEVTGPETNALAFIASMVSYTYIDGLPGWFSFLLFAITVLPYLFLIAAWVINFSTHAVAGSAANPVGGQLILGVVVIGLILSIAAFLLGLFVL